MSLRPAQMFRHLWGHNKATVDKIFYLLVNKYTEQNPSYITESFSASQQYYVTHTVHIPTIYTSTNRCTLKQPVRLLVDVLTV